MLLNICLVGARIWQRGQEYYRLVSVILLPGTRVLLLYSCRGQEFRGQEYYGTPGQRFLWWQSSIFVLQDLCMFGSECHIDILEISSFYILNWEMLSSESLKIIHGILYAAFSLQLPPLFDLYRHVLNFAWEYNDNRHCLSI